MINEWSSRAWCCHSCYFSLSDRCVVISDSGFNVHFPVSWRYCTSLHVLPCYLYVIICGVVFASLPRSVWLDCFILLRFGSLLYSLDNRPLSKMWFADIVFPICSLLIHLTYPVPALGGFPPHQQSRSRAPARCPIIQLNSDTTYPKIASDSTDKGSILHDGSLPVLLTKVPTTPSWFH